MNSTTATAGGGALRSHLVNALPRLWLAMSAGWAVVVFATDRPGWALALWTATTVGPLTAPETRLDSQAVSAATEHESTAPPPTRGMKR